LHLLQTFPAVVPARVPRRYMYLTNSRFHARRSEGRGPEQDRD